VFHVGAFPQLEDQLCSFVPGVAAAGFDDRADALVWALTDLIVQPMSNSGIYELMRQQAGKIVGSPEWHRQQAALDRAREALPPPSAEVPSGNAPSISIDEERQRFAAMLAGRQPTANETAAHEAKLLAIHNVRGNKTDELLRREAIAAGWKPRET
jgi:hypothetical protein